MTRPRTSLILLALAAVGLQIALGLALARIYLKSQNTLHNNGRWVSAKSAVEVPLMGAESFRHERQALARDSLDLGAWHGFQEVVLRDELEPERIRLRFKLDEQAWLAVFFDRPEDEPATALRLSAHRRRPSALLTVRPSG